MTSRAKILALAAFAMAIGGAVAARAQSGAVVAAIGAGAVGEQADGYLGIRQSVSPAVRAEVDQINIKRRAAYTDLAAKRGVTVQDVAASVGCQTLQSRVGEGQAYMLRDGQWRVRKGAIILPDYCG